MEGLTTQAEYRGLLDNIGKLLEEAKGRVAYSVNTVLVQTYWTIGRYIVEFEQEGKERAEYGSMLLASLSRDITLRYGRGFNRNNLQYMRKFFLVFQNCTTASCNSADDPNRPTVSCNLSWSHYCYLIYIEDDDERKFYENECINSKWSKRELKRQIDSSLFQRLLLSDGKTNKQKVLELSKKGQIINDPIDILKEPYVFEFLGIKENKPILESDLEKSLINHLSAFLMELGKGFMYVGNQIRITLDNNTHYYVDLVFYNKILRSYILIDLKIDDMKPEYVGQMNMYVNYYNKEVKDEFDNETVGIILCTGKKGVTMEYALGGLSNNIFASTYTYYIPNKNELINEVEKVLAGNK